ncbi:uncharacterized protein [Nicotiana tomentosiformis]|uniref:uncharacterized protein n=1 Tax=Nicotiana tomentosiformis TaxID=4098 RepID=UPI00388C4968
MDMSHDSLDTPLYVSTPVRNSIMVDHVYHSCLVSVGGYETRVDLLLFNTVDFNENLDMDCREEHEQHLRIVLKTMREKKLYVNFFNCEFWSDSVALLGHVVSSEGIKVDLKMIEGFSSIIAPLPRLTQKGFPFKWSDECEESFQKLKTALTTILDTVQHSDAKEVNIGNDGAELIQERLCITQSRQNSYADRKARDVSFMVGERILLRVSPMKGAMRFGKKDKLSPRYIGPFKVLERVGEVDYKLTLPPSLSGIHLVFHVSMVWKYYEDTSHVLDFSSKQLHKDLTYNEEPVAILDRQVSLFLPCKMIKLLLHSHNPSNILKSLFDVLGFNHGQDSRVIAYVSQQLKVHEKNYLVHNLELEAIVLALKIWRYDLYGVPCKIGYFKASRVLACVVSRSSLYERIRERQYDDLHLLVLKDMIQHGDAKEIFIRDDGVLQMQGRLCVQNIDGLCLPMKGVMRFEKKRKLSPRYIGPFEILERFGDVAYKLALPPSLSVVYPVFHVSVLQKYHSDLSHILDFSSVQLDKDLTCVEEPVAMLDRQVQKLKSKKIALVKVQ